MQTGTLRAGGTSLAVLEPEAGAQSQAADGVVHRVGEALRTAGAALLRGLGIATPELFREVVARFGDPLPSYRGGNTPRTALTDGVFTSTEYPPEYPISLHNELSYAHRWPERLYFCCLVPARTGGATPVCDGRALLADLDPGVRQRFESRGVTYHQHLHGGYGPGKSWQQTFETEDRAEVAEYLHTAGAEFEWTGDGLRIRQHRPATRIHPLTGETVWFNQADQWHVSSLPPDVAEVILALADEGFEPPQSATYGDGQELTPDDLDQVRAAARRHELVFPWQPGDLLVVDNMLMLHGRRPYTGPRRVVVSMT